MKNYDFMGRCEGNEAGDWAEKYKIAVMAMLLAGACFVTYYCHVVLKVGSVLAHFFYIPIILASLWWKRKGLIVAVFSSAFLIFSHIFFRPNVTSANDYLRAGMFMVVAFVVAFLSEHIAKTKGALRETRNYLENLLNYANAPIIVWDMQSRVTRFNHAFECLTGYAADEVIGQELNMLFPEASRDESLSKIERTLSGEYWESVEIPILRKDGGIQVALWNSANIYAEDSTTLLATIAQGQDITQRKQAEETMKESERKYHAFIGSSHELIFSKDRAGHYHTINLKAAIGLGKACIEDVVGKTDYDLLPKEQADALRKIDEQVMDSGEHIEAEEVVRNAQGENGIYLSHKWPSYNNKGRIDGINCFAMDITERKRAEEALKQSEAHYRLLADNATDVIWTVDLNMRLTYISPSITRLLGYSVEEAMAKTMEEVFTPASFEVVMKALVEELAIEHMEQKDLSRSRTLEVELNRNDGSIAPVELKCSFLREPDGQPVRILVIARDITERKRTEEQVQQHQNELAHVWRINTIGEMTSGLAHELNQPLCAILNYADSCLRMFRTETVNSDKLTGAMEQIATQAARAGQIVRHIRSLVSKRQPQWSTIDVNDIVRDVVGLEKTEANQSGVTIRMKLAKGVPLIFADKIQVEQVILNLVRNAFEAMSDTAIGWRRLTIETSMTGADAVEVAISDAGKGLSPESVEKVFDSFFTTKPNGLGIGLSISRSIVEAHGGRLWAESDPDSGAIFRFILPLKGAEYEHVRADHICCG